MAILPMEQTQANALIFSVGQVGSSILLTKSSKLIHRGFLREPRSGSGDESWRFSHSYTIPEWCMAQSCHHICLSKRMTTSYGLWDTALPVILVKSCGPFHIVTNLFIHSQCDLFRA